MADRNANQIQKELDAAREELMSFEVEQGNLDETEREAIDVDQRERMKAAKSGGKIRAALARRKSKLEEVENRRAELPYEIHVARVRVAELRLEHAEASLPGAEEREQQDRRELEKETKRFEKAKARFEEVEGTHYAALRGMSQVESERREAELELAALKRRGPEVSMTLPESPNRV